MIFTVIVINSLIYPHLLAWYIPQSGVAWDKGHDSMKKVFFGGLVTLYTYFKTAEDNWTQPSLTNNGQLN